MIRQAHKLLSTTTPVELTFDDNVNGVSTLIVQNTSETDYVYVGNSAVSSSDYGFMIYPRQAFTVELRPFDRLYGVGSAAIEAICMCIERST
jgi:hypothetical protein